MAPAGLAAARGIASTRRTQAASRGWPPPKARWSISTRWNDSSSSGSYIEASPYLRNGKAIASATPKPSDSRWSRPASSASNSSSEPCSSATSSGSRSPSSIRFGGRFQIRLNQSTNTSASAERAGSVGHSAGFGCVASRWRRIAVESLITAPSSSSTGTSSWPESARIAERSAGSWTTISASRPLNPRASETRSTFVEKGITWSRTNRVSRRSGRPAMCRRALSSACPRAGCPPAGRADVAQLVEHITRNDGVRGSSPRVGSSPHGWLAPDPSLSSDLTTPPHETHGISRTCGQLVSTSQLADVRSKRSGDGLAGSWAD